MHRLGLAALALVPLSTLLACGAHGAFPSRASSPPSTPLSAPSAPEIAMPKHDGVVEDIHGVKVADPFRWLEDGDSPDVKEWTAAQNARTRAALDSIPGRDALRERVRALLEVGNVGAPAVRRASPTATSRYFHTKRTGDQDQPILYVRDGRDGADRALIDPTKLGTDATTALDWWYPSEDGVLLAYGTSTKGDENSTLRVRDVSTGADLPDAIPNTRHASVAWVPDRKGFYYSRYPEVGAVPKGEEPYHCKIFFHLLGRDWKSDRLVFEPKETKEDVPSIELSPNGRWLVATVFKGWDRTEVFVRDRAKGDHAPWISVAAGVHAVFDATPRDERLYVRTNDGAARYRLFVVEYDHPDRALWREVVKENADALQGVTILGDELVLDYLHDASTRLERFTMQGKSKGEIALPSIGTAGVAGPRWGGEAFVTFTSFVDPTRVLHFDPKNGKSTIWDRVGESFQMPDVEVNLRYATSADGTKVPMFVVAKKGIALDGTNPTILYGYGGFNVNQTPSFNGRALVTVEQGGVWVSAVLRGGGEFGEAWHRAGMLEKKQDVFDDFAACARALFDAKITSPAKLGILGGSNGGLLVAASITQHPEMFAAAGALVPLTDMIRYPRYRIARLWIPEYGDPDREEDFKWLYAYSPYHQVKDGTHYPATLLATAESDSRVDPMHARKLAARLQAAQGDPSHPILLRVESNAGHGAGKPISKVVDEWVDEMSFFFAQLGARL